MKPFHPLADRIRPKTLDDFVGQSHLVGPQKPLRLAVENRQLFSMILWGPPGCGKTTLARILSQQTGCHFVEYSATSSKLADVRKVVQQAKERATLYHQSTVLFIDEIHRFNKAQQDAFLPFVEEGTIVLIGATTENPSFEVIPPLLSRCRLFVLKPLTPSQIKLIVKRGLRELGATITPKALNFLAQFSHGDARVALNTLETAVQLFKPQPRRLTLKLLKKALQEKPLPYDKAGGQHYDTISAFIKSLRASDVDAALYYLARMIAAGEDPKFIARRMVIFASEDIGMALPTALVVANETFRAVETVGLPEAQINLAHCAVYLAQAPKDRRAYEAYFRALADVKKHGALPIPLNLRNAPTPLMKKLGYGRGYQKYTRQSLLPEKLKGKKYYR